MTQLSFPATPDGLAVPVLIGLDGPATASLIASGQPVPPPALAHGLTDTGSNVTAVAPALLRRLGLAPDRQSRSLTAAGWITVDLYKISLGITDPPTAGAPMFVQPDLLVMELPTLIPGFEILIGLDILLECRFILDGPARQFALEF